MPVDFWTGLKKFPAIEFAGNFYLGKIISSHCRV